MVLAGAGRMAELQRKTAGIRNICILAHVDHGGTGGGGGLGGGEVFGALWL